MPEFLERHPEHFLLDKKADTVTLLPAPIAPLNGSSMGPEEDRKMEALGNGRADDKGKTHAKGGALDTKKRGEVE